MTAEVAVVNSTGIALAADSAVTIGSEKIYNSALKLFSLSKTEPVGVMVYGNATLMGLPWETIIKVYRKELGDRQFATLRQYSEHFFSFLTSRENLFDVETQKNWLISNVSGYYHSILTELLDSLERSIKEHGNVDEDTTQREFERIVNERHDRLSSLSFLEGMDKSFEIQIKRTYSVAIKTARGNTFNQLPISKPVVTKLNNIAAMLHSRDAFSQSTSGIVIAGFGDTELFPCMETTEIAGVINGRVKKKRLEDKCIVIEKGGECVVVPFAQDDMVESFMSGLNPSVNAFLTSFLNQAFRKLPELLTSGAEGKSLLTDRDLKQYRDDTESLLGDFFSELSKHIQKEHVAPVMNMVNSLPKDELAAMAESLVNLTAFKRKMTHTLETVGGPIDVAVISKGDGLVWVKRKHYFPRDLNQHFFANYYRGYQKFAGPQEEADE